MGRHEGHRPGEAVIGRLRVRGGGCEPLSARLRLEGLLSTLDFSPGGPPPSAIVCIHRMEDPRPRTLRLHRYEPRPPAEWEQAFRESLRERLARAARPVGGALPGEARAVVFADPAELYACLASDLGSGQAASRWWWASLFRGSDPYRALVAEWTRAPEYVPASLDLVARWGRAEAFLRRLGETEARELLARVNRRFGLRALEDALAGGRAELPVEPPGELRAGAGTREAPDVGTGESPWRRWAPEVDSAVLGLEPATLLGVALMIRRAPRVIDLPGTAAAVAGWRERMRGPSGEVRSGEVRSGEVRSGGRSGPVPGEGPALAMARATSPGSTPAKPPPHQPRDSGREEPRDPAAPPANTKVAHVPPAQRLPTPSRWPRLPRTDDTSGIAAVSPISTEEPLEAGAPSRTPSPPARTGAHAGRPSTLPATAEPSPTQEGHQDPAGAYARTSAPSSAFADMPRAEPRPCVSFREALAPPSESTTPSGGSPSPSAPTGLDSAHGTPAPRTPLHASPPHAGPKPRVSFREALAPPPAPAWPSEGKPSHAVSTGPDSAHGTPA
ncbi:hypothetical protein Q664_03235, partial [Archangium violaceum Cb vi76]